MPAHTSRPITALPAAVLAVLLVPGCGAAGNTPGTTDPASAGKHTPVAPLTVAQLKDAALTDADVPQVKAAMSAQEVKRQPGKFPPVSEPACRTYLDIRTGERSYARVEQLYDWKDDVYPGNSTLASYEAGAAERNFAELKKALAACRTFEAENWAGKHAVSITVEAPPPFGDEAVTLREHVPLPEGPPADKQVTVVRAGNTIATFTRLDIGRSSSFPTELIERQVARLNNVQQNAASADGPARGEGSG
ncbi:hypothetical protein ACFW6V_29525 [Streptomyces sp. NPDC058734]|uniref:hypothetical protein n=1 Tax=Streptomyces sp. NPDC058734 TaxID=3346615 RepID=UPI0036C04010